MYPYARLAWHLFKHRKSPRLGVAETHVSHHICFPWDTDPWREMNNGRILTIYDLGRIPLALRTGLIGVLRRKRWALTMAGASVRYRRRVRMFERVEMRTRLAWWDDRFFYLEQSMWKTNGECASHILYRSAVTDRNGIVPAAKLAQELQFDPTPPPAPDWITAWIAAEATRPWPPMQD